MLAGKIRGIHKKIKGRILLFKIDNKYLFISDFPHFGVLVYPSYIHDVKYLRLWLKQVAVKMKSKHMAGTFTKKKKCKENLICYLVASALVISIKTCCVCTL